MTQIVGIYFNPARSAGRMWGITSLSAKQWLDLLLRCASAYALANTHPKVVRVSDTRLVVNRHAPMPLGGLYSSARDGQTNLERTDFRKDGCKSQKIPAIPHMKAFPSLKPALFAVSFLLAQRGQCAEVALSFDTLPSAQGWAYITLGQPAEETAVFTVANGSLLQNTVGIGGGIPGSSVYRLLDSVNSSQPFTLTMRARVLNDEDFTGQQDRPFGFSVAVFTGVEEFGFGLSKQSLQTVDGIFGGSPTIPFDATAFHDYRIEAQPGVRYDLFVDSILFTSGSPYPLQFPSSISLGDGTGAANATAEITRLEFSQLSQVPEPSTLTLALAGAVALFGWQWKRALGTAF